MSEFLTLVNVGDMNFHYGAFHAPYTVLQGYAGMCVGTGIENNSVVTESYFLQLIDELALDIVLIILYLDIGIFSLQLWKVTFERIVAVNTRPLIICIFISKRCFCFKYQNFFVLLRAKSEPVV